MCIYSSPHTLLFRSLIQQAQESQNIINQKLMSAAEAGACAKAAYKINQQVGWFPINYSHSVEARNHANIRPKIKAQISKSSYAKGGEWCTDDVRKDKMVRDRYIEFFVAHV